VSILENNSPGWKNKIKCGLVLTFAQHLYCSIEFSGVTGKTSMDAFKRMEEKVEALEAAAEVSEEMGRMGALPGTADLEKQFKLLEAGSSVDDELERMKRNLLTGSSSASDDKSKSGSKPVDDELERLKREAGL
jgi:phage shock protein A